MKRWLRRAAWLLVVGMAIGAGVYGFRRIRSVEAVSSIPTAPVRVGEFLEMVTCRGELVAARSRQITAPFNVPDLRIVWLAPASSQVKKDDTVVRFDGSSAKQQLAEKQAALRQAQAALDQAVSHARITAEQDYRDLISGRHQVERAKLQMTKAEIESPLKGETAKVDLGLVEDKLRVQEATTDLHKASDAAKIASLTRVRDRAQEEVDTTQRRLERMELKSPGDGVFIIMVNTSQGWMNARPFQAGDRAWPGSAIAEIPDLRTLEMKAKVEEIDRARLSAGQEVRLLVDALPERPLKAKLRMISPLTEQNWEWPPTRNFRAHAELIEFEERMRPGMNGRMDIILQRRPNTMSIPAKALYSKHGRPIAYVAVGGRFRVVPVEVVARNTDEIAIKGLQPGQSVAMAEVEAKDLTP